MFYVMFMQVIGSFQMYTKWSHGAEISKAKWLFPNQIGWNPLGFFFFFKIKKDNFPFICFFFFFNKIC